jgi:quercetin dioxygenase-like cupin family protein
MNIINTQNIEDLIRSTPDATTDFDVEHYQIDGVYVRSLFITAGMVLTGKIHNHEHIAILAQGTIRVYNGEEYKEISAPCTWVERAGIKRLGYALTDCTFINVIRTDLKDIADIENEAVSNTFEEFETRRIT